MSKQFRVKSLHTNFVLISDSNPELRKGKLSHDSFTRARICGIEFSTLKNLFPLAKLESIKNLCFSGVKSIFLFGFNTWNSGKCQESYSLIFNVLTSLKNLLFN